VPLIEAAGGTVLCRGSFREEIVGDDFPEFIAVIQFPDTERVHLLIESAAYRGWAFQDPHVHQRPKI
jgi:uncharacterized protein (DUF1330 family)